MDQFFPTQKAATKLEDLSAHSKETIAARDHLNVQHLSEPKLDNVHVTDTGRQRRSWRLCTARDDDGTVDEVIFRIQGVITKNELVPKDSHKCPIRKAIYLTQHIEICGLDNTIFEDCVRHVATITQKFAEHIAGVPFTTVAIKEGADGPCISASNRLFSCRSDVPTEQDNDFQDGVDALGHLAKLKGTDLIHAPENIVSFFRVTNGASPTSNSGDRYVKQIPGAFKVGDLVEMQLAFVAIMAHKTIKVTNRLQALTMLDDEYTKEASTLRSAAIAKPPLQVGIRRKVGYFQEDEEDAREYKKKKLGQSEPE
ncbi:hypothetical protein DFH06DRAFT_1137831 [Mycena polygramma]|nr:hypothetical protein DFH06DRAFT_1137831 [Mycena polygramma]